MQLKDLNDPEVFLALKRICEYLVNEAWNTSADIDYDYAVAKTKEYEADIRELANLDGELEWGDEKVPTGTNAWSIRHVGDFNTWYKGSLTLRDFLQPLEILAETMYNTSPQYMPETEFLHYYEFLQSKLPKPPERTKAQPVSITLNSLHPKIQEHCRRRFNSKNYADAILAAYKVVLNEIKGISGIHDLDGKQLIERTFAPANPIIKLNPLTTQSDKDEQQGFMFLFSGAAVGIRNPKAHDLVVQEDKEKALYYLAFASLLLTRLDERLEPKPAVEET